MKKKEERKIIGILLVALLFVVYSNWDEIKEGGQVGEQATTQMTFYPIKDSYVNTDGSSSNFGNKDFIASANV